MVVNQLLILSFVNKWVHHNSTPIALVKIIDYMDANKKKDCTTINAVNSLVKKGYLRRTKGDRHQTFFVMLKSI